MPEWFNYAPEEPGYYYHALLDKTCKQWRIMIVEVDDGGYVWQCRSYYALKPSFRSDEEWWSGPIVLPAVPKLIGTRMEEFSFNGVSLL